MAKYDPETYWSRVAVEISKRRGKSVLGGDDNPYLRMKRKKFLAKFLDTIDFRGKVVLEVGCGPGGNLLHIAQRSGPKRLIGVDISQDMIELARTNLARHSVSAELYKVDGLRLPFPDRSIDICFTVTVLQHDTDENMFRTLVEEMCRVTNETVIAMEDTGGAGIAGLGDHIDRRVDVFESVFGDYGFALASRRYLSIRASRFLYFRLLPIFRHPTHQEGQPDAPLLRAFLTLLLPISRIVDAVIEDDADLTEMVFSRRAA